MALILNTTARYLSAQPEYSAVQINDRWRPPGVSKRGIRGMTAANGGDVSQLGAERLTMDYRLQLFVPTRTLAYFQPYDFDLDEPGVIAARVSVTLDEVEPWEDDVVEAVQKGLIPKEDLTEAEINQIVVTKMRSVAPELPLACQVVSAFINNAAEGNNALRAVILSASDGIADADTRTVVAGVTNEVVPAITAVDVAQLSIEHLTTLTDNADRANPQLLSAISLLSGVAYAAIEPRFAAAFEPFSTAIERARVDRVTNIDQAVVDEAINYEGILATAMDAGELRNTVTIQVVRASSLNVDYLNDLTDQDFTEDEIAALHADVAGNANANDLASARAKIAIAEPADESDWIATVNGGSDDDAHHDMYRNVGNWEALTMSADDEDYLMAVGKYAMAAPTTRVIQIRNTSGPALCDFATTRMNTIDHELHGGCNEVRSFDGMIWGAISLPKAKMLFDAVSEDIVGQVQHSTAHISYMKSAHHASANNIGHTFTKLLDAINHTYDVSDIPERLAFGTYYGSKPADQRAVAVWLRHKYTNNELSFAIGRRITPHGPGTVSMFLLNMVVEQLKQVEFFKFMQREEDYTQFKGMYASYAKTSYLEVPYARFFYGTSKAESVDLKQSVAPMFAYAAAIGAAMPNSTIADSVALRREATAAASNSITAKLEVESFVKSYRSFLRNLIRNRLTAKANLSGASATIEDSED